MVDTIRNGRGRIEPTLGSKEQASHADWRLPDSGAGESRIVSLFRRRAKAPQPPSEVTTPPEPPLEKRPRVEALPEPRGKPAPQPKPEAKPDRAKVKARGEEPAATKPPSARRSLWFSP